MSEYVTVTAADWNGRSFDGCPFSETPEWLMEAVTSGKINADTPNDTDYAEWWIDTPEGRRLASAGDIIHRNELGELTIEYGPDGPRTNIYVARQTKDGQ
jgi:hypothetical protein